MPQKSWKCLKNAQESQAQKPEADDQRTGCPKEEPLIKGTESKDYNGLGVNILWIIIKPVTQNLRV